MTTVADEYVSASDLAALTGLAPATFRSWRRRGYGPKSLKLGGRVIYKLTDVTAWIAEQEHATASRGAYPAATS